MQGTRFLFLCSNVLLFGTSTTNHESPAQKARMWLAPLSLNGISPTSNANIPMCDTFHRQTGTSPIHGRVRLSIVTFIGSTHVGSAPKAKAVKRTAARYPQMSAGAVATATVRTGTESHSPIPHGHFSYCTDDEGSGSLGRMSIFHACPSFLLLVAMQASEDDFTLGRAEAGHGIAGTWVNPADCGVQLITKETIATTAMRGTISGEGRKRRREL